MLYIIGTPIGNMSDITLRAKETFEKLDILYCEDTRKTGMLLNKLGIKVSLKRADENSLDRVIPVILDQSQTDNIGFCTDAGMPTISDPGTKLIAEAHRKNTDFEIIPGVSALDVAITASGFPSQPMIFYGFLPKKKGRKTLFESWIEEHKTIVFYESPHRIIKTLNEILDYCGDRYVCVSREMTKQFEEHYRGKISEVLPSIKEKGEFTVTVAPTNWRE